MQEKAPDPEEGVRGVRIYCKIYCEQKEKKRSDHEKMFLIIQYAAGSFCLYPGMWP